MVLLAGASQRGAWLKRRWWGWTSTLAHFLASLYRQSVTFNQVTIVAEDEAATNEVRIAVRCILGK